MLILAHYTGEGEGERSARIISSMHQLRSRSIAIRPDSDKAMLLMTRGGKARSERYVTVRGNVEMIMFWKSFMSSFASGPSIVSILLPIEMS